MSIQNSAFQNIINSRVQHFNFPLVKKSFFLNKYLPAFDRSYEGVRLETLYIYALTKQCRAISKPIRIFVIFAFLADDECLRNESEQSSDCTF